MTPGFKLGSERERKLEYLIDKLRWIIIYVDDQELVSMDVIETETEMAFKLLAELLDRRVILRERNK